MRSGWLSVVSVALLCGAAALLAATTLAFAAPPATPKKPITDTYHGIVVTDEYRWLENGNDKDVRNWSEAQNAHARSLLDKEERQ